MSKLFLVTFIYNAWVKHKSRAAFTQLCWRKNVLSQSFYSRNLQMKELIIMQQTTYLTFSSVARLSIRIFFLFFKMWD